MKKRISIIMALVLMLSTIFSVNVFAATSYPTISSSKYIEFKAQNSINVYKNTACTTRGTSSPAKAYNASIASGDVCYIYKITSSYIQVNYPTSSGRKTGYIKRADLISVSSPSEIVTSNGKATTYVTPGGKSYGNTEANDKVYACGTSGGYTAVIYTAKSGKRAFKFGWVTTNDYNSIIKNSGGKSALLFPLKGSITRTSQSAKTNGYYCDYKTGGSKPIYAPADGKVVFKQAYRNVSGTKKLSSYGNFVEFTSSDGVYKVKCCHLTGFNGVSTTVKSSLKYPCSGSDGVLTLKTKTVKQGDLLGYTGYTGNASAHHLHIEVYKGGIAKNPIDIFNVWN